jgi:hypothetical protein
MSELDEESFTQIIIDEAFDAGKKFAQNKVLALMDEVIEQYDGLSHWSEQENDMGCAGHEQAQLNAAKFIKSWVLSGGHEDEDGNRVCLPW